MTKAAELVQQAHEHTAQQRMAQATKCLITASALEPDNPEILNSLANAHRAQGNHDEALVLYERAVALNAAFWKAHYNIAVMVCGSDKARALSHVECAITAKCPHASPYILAVKLLGQDGKTRSKAAGYLRSALEHEPENTSVKTNLGVLLTQLGRHDDARQLFNDVIAAVPEHVEANFNLAFFMQTVAKDHVLARCHYETVLQHAPSNKAAKLNLAHLLIKEMKLPAAALPLVRDLVSSHPEDGAYHALLTEALLATGAPHDEVLFYASKALKLQPTDAETAQLHDTALRLAPSTPSGFRHRLTDLSPGTPMVLPDLACVHVVSLQAATLPFPETVSPFTCAMAVEHVSLRLRAEPTLSKLTVEEAAAIWLYTWVPDNQVTIPSVINTILRSGDCDALAPLLPFMKLMMSALAKMPRKPSGFNRGSLGDHVHLFTKGSEITWPVLASCTPSVEQLESLVFDEAASDKRTHVVLSCADAVDVACLSRYPDDHEVLVPYGARFTVESVKTLRGGLISLVNLKGKK